MELRQIADRLLSLLPPGDRTMLVLKEMEDFTIEDLAGIYKISKKRRQAEVVPSAPPVAACL